MPVPAAFIAAICSEQVLRLGIGQRSGRLVQDEEVATARETGGDLDHLLLAHAQRAQGAARIETLQAYAFEERTRLAVELAGS